MDISIIVPLYKGNRYIKNILYMVNENNKVLEERGIAKKIEIILVNDYPDESIKFLEISNCCNIVLRIYENTRNIGIHKSRLKGLEKSKGAYILFLDQDDEIQPSYLWSQLEYLGEADAVICNGIYRNNKVIYKDYEQQREAVSKDEYLKKGNIIVSPGQILMKKEAIPNTWTKYVLRENGSDDVLLWTLMLCEGKRFAVNPYLEYQHKEEGENLSLNFVNMERSVEELLHTVSVEGLLKGRDLVVFTEASKRRIEKYRRYIDLLENWDMILKKIIVLFRKKTYKNIAIYGYGIIGKRLLHDLEKRKLKPYCFIDKAASNFRDMSYKIYDPENLPKEVDLIILTPLFAEEEIKNGFKKYETKIVSLQDI